MVLCHHRGTSASCCSCMNFPPIQMTSSGGRELPSTTTVWYWFYWELPSTTTACYWFYWELLNKPQPATVSTGSCPVQPQSGTGSTGSCPVQPQSGTGSTGSCPVRPQHSGVHSKCIMHLQATRNVWLNYTKVPIILADLRLACIVNV